jgi:hypothetical protein
VASIGNWPGLTVASRTKWIVRFEYLSDDLTITANGETEWRSNAKRSWS